MGRPILSSTPQSEGPERARLAATDPAEVMARAPVTRYFGWRLVERDLEHAVLALPLRPEFVQEEGRVHGGILAALGDTAGVYVLAPDLPVERAITTSSMEVHFLRAARTEGSELVATATAIKRGRTLALCEVSIAQDGRELVRGTYTYVFFDAAGA